MATTQERAEQARRANAARIKAEIAQVHERQRRWEEGGREEWLAAHDFPRCEHGLSLSAICEPCRGWEVPSSAFKPDSDPAPKVRICRQCGGSGAASRSGLDLCAACWGSGRDD